MRHATEAAAEVARRSDLRGRHLAVFVVVFGALHGARTVKELELHVARRTSSSCVVDRRAPAWHGSRGRWLGSADLPSSRATREVAVGVSRRFCSAYAIVGGPALVHLDPWRVFAIAEAAVVVVPLVAVASISLAGGDPHEVVLRERQPGTANIDSKCEGDLAACQCTAQIRRIGDPATAFNLMAAKLEERLLAEK